MQVHSCDMSTVNIAVETGDRRVTTDLMCGLLVVSTFFGFLEVVTDGRLAIAYRKPRDVATRSVDAEVNDEPRDPARLKERS
jgi:hypothetical protein